MTPRKGESREAFRRRRAKFDSQPEQRARHRMPPPSQSVAEMEREIAKLKAEIAKRDAADHERDLASSMAFKPLVVSVESRKNTGTDGLPMMMWSDWHCGETVDKRETGGYNEFNREVFEARVQKLVRGTIGLLKDHTAGVDPGAWVLLGGDMVSGLIHDELVETNWGNIVEQATEVAGAITGGLLGLADALGGPVHIAGVVGNHGRTTARPRAKGRALDSYDRAVYHSVARKLESDPRFVFHLPDDTDILLDVYGHKFLLTHGDSLGVKGGDGIIGPLGPIARGAVKLRNSLSAIGRGFDTLVIGHWHQYTPRGDALGVIVNGTLKGYDEYARLFLRARPARPSQALWLVHPKNGIAAQWPVWCD